MCEKLEALKKEVWSHFKPIQFIYLATCEGNKPRVRPVTLVYFNNKFWAATGMKAAKTKQIKENENIEFCLLLKKGENSGYIRGAGIANIIQERETKKLLADNIPFFKDYWEDSDDPNFALLEIVIKGIEYLKPGEFAVERFSV